MSTVAGLEANECCLQQHTKCAMYELCVNLKRVLLVVEYL